MTRSRALRSVTFVGRGKVGTALARAASAAGLDVAVVPSRPRLRVRPADLFVLTVADAATRDVAAALAASGVPPTAVVHTAGLLPPDHLAPLREEGWSVGQAHPLASFAGGSVALARGATLLVGGDRLAVARCRALARDVGLRPFTPEVLDRAAWHAVAALVANGAAALAALGAARWAREGIPARAASQALGALLASVAVNVEELGADRALSGPVRRGDDAVVARHLDVLASGREDGAVDPAATAYAALALAQLPLARSLGEASPGALRRIEETASATLSAGERRPSARRRPFRPATRRGKVPR